MFLGYSVTTTQPFGVTTLSEDVVRVANGTETVVDPRANNQVRVSASAKIFGFLLSTNDLLKAWNGGGAFILRVYRGNEKIAEGHFTLRSG